MTNELTKTFFDTFGIEQKFKGYSNTEELSTGVVIPCGNIKYFNTIEEMDKANYWCFNMWELDEEDKGYPQITDRILLELLFILTTLMDTSVYEDVFVTVAKNIEELKKDVLEECITYAEHIKHQVRTLFEEG